MANYNLLQAIQPPQVVGQLPAVDPNRSQNTFIEGALSGVLQGQQMQSNNMTLQKQRQEMADQQALRNAKTEDAWLNTLQSQGKHDEALKYKTYQLQYQNQLLQNKSSMMDLNQKERDKADRDNAINVTVMSQVSQLPPDQQESTYQKYRNDLTKKYPDMVMPEQFNAETFASVMRTNQVMQVNHVEESTEKVKTLTQLETRLDNLQATKAQYEKTGRPTGRIQDQIKNTQNLINTHVTNKQTVEDNKEDIVNKELLKLDVEDVKNTDAQSGDAVDRIEQYETFKKLNKQFKTGMFGETKLGIQKAYTALTGKDLKTTKYGEAILAKGMDFVFDRIKESKGAISDKEMEAFEKASPGMKNTQGGNELIMDIGINIEKRKIELTKAKKEYLREHKSLDGFKEEWSKYVEKNPIVDVKKLQGFSNEKAPKATVPNLNITDVEAEMKRRGLL
jgi:hypothetical protein